MVVMRAKPSVVAGGSLRGALCVGVLRLIAEPSSASTAWIARLALALRRHAACTSRFGGRRSGREDVPTLRRILGVAGALVLLYIGVRSLRSAFRAKAAEDEKPDNVTLRPLAAFRMALAATASNPATIGYWAAAFAAATAANVTRTAVASVAMLVGVGCGMALWFAVLSFGATVLQRRHRLQRTGAARGRVRREARHSNRRARGHDLWWKAGACLYSMQVCTFAWVAAS